MDDNGNSLMGVAQEDLDEVLGKAAEEIPVAVAGSWITGGMFGKVVVQPTD